MLRSFRFAPLVALALLTAGRAQAEDKPALDLRGFRPSPDPQASLYLEPTATPGHLMFNGSAWLSYAYRPVVLRDGHGDVVSKLVSHQLSADVTLGTGLGKRFYVGIGLPIALYQVGSDDTYTRAAMGGHTVPGSAVGDLALFGKATLMRQGELGGFGLALTERATVGTGSATSTLSDHTFTSETRLLAELTIVAVSVEATTGIFLRGKERTFGGDTYGSDIPWGLALRMRPQILGLDNKGRMTWVVEAHGALPLAPDAPFTNAAQAPASVGPSIRYALGTRKDVSVLAGVEAGVTHGIGAAPIRGVLALSVAPRPHDRDHDGVEDDVDECPELAEDKDGFEDSDGCPELDNDDDGVLDPDDKCPTQKEDQDGFEDDDGCPDPDNDKDGIPDVSDACPKEAGPANADKKKNGCPVHDIDSDGVPDAKDRCPDVPEDKDGFKDEDGCPDPDNDQDGVPDGQDACPNEKGEATDDPKTNGCPVRDADHDGIPDDQDKCPKEAETYNGKDDEDGCPEPASPRDKPLVKVEDTKGALRFTTAKPIPFPTALSGDAAKKATIEENAMARAMALALRDFKGGKVKIAVRPAKQPKGDEAANAAATSLANAIDAAANRKVALVVPWDKATNAAGADISGVSLVVEGTKRDPKTDEPKPDAAEPKRPIRIPSKH